MITFFRILLFPLSLVFLCLVYFRNLFYDKNIFKSYKLSKPVISIGNISTGGTGKSPFTIFLANYLLDNNLKPAIISRGYKRKSKEIEVVYNGKEIISTSDKCGDEPLMMAQSLSLKHKNFFIITGSNRVETANFAINKFNPDIIILDDAFQHRKIKRNLDIVLMDSGEMINNKFLNSIVLPAGNLRENINNLSRANIIIQNNKLGNFKSIDRLNKFGKDIFTLNYYVKGFYNVNNEAVDIKGKDICAFAGIASPDSFFDEIKKYDCKLTEFISYKDHYNYTENDIMRITLKATKDTYFITTEKDFVKIKGFTDFLNYFNVLFMKIELNLNKSEKFFAVINNLIESTKKIDY